MKCSPTASTAPQGSQIAARLPGAYFHDAWVIQAAEPKLDALEQFLRVARKTPAWIDRLMALRNRIVALFGLKNLGSIAQIDPNKKATDYQAGDHVGIFTLFSSSANEVLLGDSDKHLRVVVSVHKQADAAHQTATITVTTVVHIHNWLGRLYMVPVTPAHRVIARSMVSAIGKEC
ncbi:MAG: DUF2867 domain-containing protein [Brachymonas sp.]|nr:DUF2867 domain-containing protein [Brachymonas sp.]